MSMADHGNGGEVETVEGFARWQPRLQQMSLNTSLGSLGEFEFGKGCQQARRRPALTIGTFGECLPQLGDGGQTQFPQQQRQASGIDGDAVAHATAPVVAHAVAAIAGTNTS